MQFFEPISAETFHQQTFAFLLVEESNNVLTIKQSSHQTI